MTAFFDNAYEGVPSWDVGHPHAAVVGLAAAGFVEGRILDLGCGTGADALYLAGLGHEVVGLDFAAAAIERAAGEAVRRGARARFVVGDALALPEAALAGELGCPFETALDVGLFHTLQPVTRGAYAASVRTALRPGGRLLLVCWSERNPFGRGPERISRRDIRLAFAEGWTVEAIDPGRLETLLEEGGVHAWVARLRRLV